ncbi:AzlD domain-containing protein [Lachnospiraceae bacterium MD1]|uniref:AzlD domain-containing protein n=1 Tax=Variimorphobacter saccharofermentans TaxID=2755051 RepID=A0A839JV25_9FIRM|nr:AzlD domain-containing protein [Variimorphobacter saccharofermentans]MBB2181340.1 AzlD domain-containing protein [Variimorphobacter saccharofermentans]
MNYTTTQLFIFFGIVVLGTVITRALPFLLFPEKKEIPKYVNYLADILPYTIIGMLVVYCLKDVSILKAPYGLPEAISIVAIIILHIWKKNTLLSIGGGALLYMLLVQYF